MRNALMSLSWAVLVLTTGELSAQQSRPASEQAMADYRSKLKDYNAAQEKFEAVAGPYWTLIEDKRRTRRAKRANNQEIALSDYVLTQPPKYVGPPRPLDPSVKPEDQPPEGRAIPLAADFLRQAKEHFGFVPDKPDSEIAYKRAYAATASAAGITKDQAVRVYGFESGGNGKYDVQAGLEYERSGARAISTALGYNQLLTANTAGLLAEKGDQFLKALQRRAAASFGERKTVLEKKVETLRTMVSFSRTVPVQWGAHVTLGRTPKGLGLHALNLDIDIGPLLQTQKLLDSVVFARVKGIGRPLAAAELEMMNLTGDGNGFDMIAMPQAMRPQVPTANFFQRGGYERNPVASRKTWSKSCWRRPMPRWTRRSSSRARRIWQRYSSAGLARDRTPAYCRHIAVIPLWLSASGDTRCQCASPISQISPPAIPKHALHHCHLESLQDLCDRIPGAVEYQS